MNFAKLLLIFLLNFTYLFSFDIAKYDTYQGSCPTSTVKNYASKLNLSISCNSRDYPYCPSNSFTIEGIYDTNTYFEAYCSLDSSDDFLTDYKKNSYTCSEYRYACISDTCDDGGKSLEVSSTVDGHLVYYNICDRACEDVNMITGENGNCIQPDICNDKANQCSDSCNGNVESFVCTDGTVTTPCVCSDSNISNNTSNSDSNTSDNSNTTTDTAWIIDLPIKSDNECPSDSHMVSVGVTSTNYYCIPNDDDISPIYDDSCNQIGWTLTSQSQPCNNNVSDSSSSSSNTDDTSSSELNNNIATSPAGGSNDSNNIDLNETNNILNQIKDTLQTDTNESSFNTSVYEDFLSNLSDSFSNFQNDFNTAKELINGGFTFNTGSYSNLDGCIYSSQVFNKEIKLDICTPFIPFKNFISLIVFLSIVYQSIRIFIFTLIR